MTAHPTSDQEVCVYKLIPLKEWDTLIKAGAIPMSSLDQSDGFMHLSSKEQYMETANLHYTDYSEILCIELTIEKLEGNLVWEAAMKRDGALFPHLYGRAPVEAIQATHLLRRNQDQTFTDEGPSSQYIITQ